METAQLPMVEGRHEQCWQPPTLCARGQITDDGRDGFGRAHAFEFDVDQHVLGYEVEHFVQRGNPLAVPGVETPELREGQFANQANAVRRPVDTLIVDHDDFGFGQVDVEFHAVDAEFDGAGESGKRVLRGKARRTAMTDDQQAFGTPVEQAAAAGSPVVWGNMPSS